jgi:hypothetical protein
MWSFLLVKIFIGLKCECRKQLGWFTKKPLLRPKYIGNGIKMGYCSSNHILFESCYVGMCNESI